MRRYCEKNIRFIAAVIKSFCKKEFSFPDVSTDYPGTFHTNVRSGFRGSQIGSKLLVQFEKLMFSKGVCGIHCGTISEKACSYYKKHGFELLYSGKQSYLKPFTGKIVTYYLLGKKLKTWTTEDTERKEKRDKKNSVCSHALDVLFGKW